MAELQMKLKQYEKSERTIAAALETEAQQGCKYYMNSTNFEEKMITNQLEHISF